MSSLCFFPGQSENENLKPLEKVVANFALKTLMDIFGTSEIEKN